MATKRAESGEVLQPPTKQPPSKQQRKFPWRLWFYAIVMTGAAGAGGFFTYKFREDAKVATASSETCMKANTTAAATATATEKASCDKQRTAQATEFQSVKDAQDKHAKELEKQLGDVSKNLNASKEELKALLAQKVETEKQVEALKDLQRQFATMVETGTLKVTARRGSLVLSLPSEVLFKSGSAELSKPAGENAVREVAFTLKKLPDRRFLVLGHTDDQPLVHPKTNPPAPLLGPKDNWELSTARALTVTKLLVEAGMDPKNVVPAGVGEHDPIGKDRAKNRRIEIALLPAISELPQLPASLTDPATPAPATPAKPAPAKP